MASLNCAIPHDLLVSVLSRLPAKSLLRFQLVCKQWRSLITNPQFIALHRRQSPQSSFVLYSLSVSYDHLVWILDPDSPARKATLIRRFSERTAPVFDLVGSCNGLICLASFPPSLPRILLSNPASGQDEVLDLEPDRAFQQGFVSYGFGFDSEDCDYKVVRVRNGHRVRVDVYSTRSGSWDVVKVGFEFKVCSTRNDAIVNGNPYWEAEFEASKNLVCYDVRNDFVMDLPFPMELIKGIRYLFVEWKGSLASLVYYPKLQPFCEFMHVSTFDEGKWCWSKTFKIGPVGMEVGNILQCSRDGKVLAETLDGELYLFDHERNSVEVIHKEHAHSHKAFSYMPSLSSFMGMKQYKRTEKP